MYALKKPYLPTTEIIEPELTIEISADELAIIKKFAAEKSMSVEEFAKQTMIEKVEDERDLQILRKAMAEDDGIRVSHEDVMKTFEL